MLTNVPTVLVRMVASVLIPQEGTNARVSGDGIQGGTAMKVSLGKKVRHTNVKSSSDMVKLRYKKH